MKSKTILAVLIFSLGFFTLKVNAQDLKTEVDNLLSKYNEYGYFNGTALIEKGGKVILKKGYGFANYEWDIPNTPDVKFRIGSMTKQFTATLIMQLVEEGKIKLDGKLTDYLKDYRKETGNKVTIRELLNHTSGIPSYTSLPHVWNDSLRNHYKEDYFIKHFCSGNLEFTPGSKFSYNNTGYYLLAVICEKVSGKPFNELLKEKILDPLKMYNSGAEAEEKPIKKMASGYIKAGFELFSDPYIYMPNALGAGNMYSTVEDLAKWDKALYDNKILSEKSKKEMFTPNKFGYGYGWFVYSRKYSPTDSAKIIWHTGGINGFNTIISREPKTKDLVLLFNNTGTTQLVLMTQKIYSLLHGLKVEFPQKPIKDYLYKTILDEGIDRAISTYKYLKKESPNLFDFSENQLNYLGYWLLKQKRFDDAVKIFKLNAEAFPNSSNVYDSMGEGLLAKGDTTEAIKYYKKSIELNPGNENGLKILKKLGVKTSTSKGKPTLEELKSYAGEYQLFPNFSIFISEKNGHLFAKATGQPEFEIFPMSKTKFYYKVVNAQIKFVESKNGKVNSLILFQNGKEMPAKKIK